ncbi:neurogenic protein mastermind-like isoform X2 [Pomacea canaliculata]|uniref:neurogenic protein mastermind-like isoform X2 n=1 Tax=Pomacea canaliculata TaxID=400727 RepID=UPI000D733CF8|nr:neurogenic protein mastermind-like isoform X2 [Pomacea canaliculata]
MGDFLAPKRRDVVDRLRRRIEQYRCHHLQAGRRFDSSRLGLFEQQRQDSQHLHQRWLENKAKKAAKHSKVKDTSGTGAAASSSQTEHRNLVTKLKRKIDSSHADNSAAAAEAFQFDDNSDQQPATNVGGSQANKSSSHTNTNVSSSTTSVGVSSAAGQEGATLPHLSVQIVQQISQSPQTIHTNVTVSSTLQTRYPGSASPSPNVNVHTSTSSQHTHANNSGSGSHLGASGCGTNAVSKAGGSTANPGGSGAGGGGAGGGVGGAPGSETSVLTSIECKQEPLDDIHCHVSADSSAGCVPDLGIDELTDILDSIEKDTLIKELDNFNAIYNKVQRDSESNAESSSIFSSLGSCSSPGLCKAAAPFTDPSQVGIQPHVSLSGGPPPALTPTMFEAAHPLGGLGANTTGLPIRPPPSLVEPTGPAAETLKQMAAQHQHQTSAATPFSSKSLEHSAFPDPYEACGFGRRNGYPAAYQNQTFSPVGAATGGAGYAGYGQSSGYESPTPMAQYTGGKRELNPLAYGGTKPLTHYPTEHGGPGNHGGSPQPPARCSSFRTRWPATSVPCTSRRRSTCSCRKGQAAFSCPKHSKCRWRLRLSNNSNSNSSSQEGPQLCPYRSSNPSPWDRTCSEGRVKQVKVSRLQAWGCRPPTKCSFCRTKCDENNSSISIARHPSIKCTRGCVHRDLHTQEVLVEEGQGVPAPHCRRCRTWSIRLPLRQRQGRGERPWRGHDAAVRRPVSGHVWQQRRLAAHGAGLAEHGCSLPPAATATAVVLASR